MIDRIINMKPFRRPRRGNRMVNCPICGKELRKQAPGGWRCECGEFIPSEFASHHEAKCSCCCQGHH